MTVKLIVPDHPSSAIIHDELLEFKLAVKLGLMDNKKNIQSKYFYDEKGCELFDKITRHPDYYLTRSELEIFNKYKKEMSEILHHDHVNLIELGPGEGIKTEILIKQLLEDSQDFSYYPIDISKKYLHSLMRKFKNHFPNLDMTALNCDYFDAIKWLNCSSHRRNCVLFLGSSIGNFDDESTRIFLNNLSSVLNHGDLVLVGFDLCKDINILMKAYNDNEGITRDFNLNLLNRINQELNANFNVNYFSHYATYNVNTKSMESYLISKKQQTVSIELLDLTLNFNEMEPIHVEISRKFIISEINKMANEFQFEVISNFCDENNYFVDALWRVNKLGNY